jgi:hypothetical protein
VGKLPSPAGRLLCLPLTDPLFQGNPRRWRELPKHTDARDTCVTQEPETLGIVPVFWKDEGNEEEGPAVLPMVRPG